jgi:hypothetical protein
MAARSVSRVFVDTNVLFPFSVMDLMLALTEDAAHEVLWTERLLAEWQHVIVNEQRRSPESAASITMAIREFFAEFLVAEEDYVELIGQMPARIPMIATTWQPPWLAGRAPSSRGTGATFPRPNSHDGAFK